MWGLICILLWKVISSPSLPVICYSSTSTTLIWPCLKLQRLRSLMNFSVEMHVTYILSMCSQRIFLLIRLRDQGLPVHYLDLVFHAIVVSRIIYALPVWGSCLSSEHINRINTFFKRSYRCGFAKQINDIVTLVDNASKDLFGKTMAPHHCLHSILSLQTEKKHDLRTRGHNYPLPQCKYNVHTA